MRQTKIVLSDKEIPTKWYNIMADMPNLPKPPLHPATKQPVGPQDLTPIFPMALIEQEMTQERWIDIPEEVLDIYSLWRPAPLFRAHRLEKLLGTPAKIYYKYEGVSPAGSHKPNTAIPQAYYNKQAGMKRIATETGAGQWGTSMALAGKLFGLDVTVYMVKVSVRPEALPQDHDGDLGRHGACEPVEHDELGQEDPRARPRTTRAASASPSPRRWRTRPRTMTRTMRSDRS